MAITSAICTSFKNDILQGIHDAADVYKLALYTDAATLGASTAAYSATNEVSGTGYTAGGVTLSGYSVTTDGTTAVLDFADVSIPAATITARGYLIYNSSKSNKAVRVEDFGSNVSSTADAFTITFPAATAAAGLIRIG